jgi:hypothetical protein
LHLGESEPYWRDAVKEPVMCYLHREQQAAAAEGSSATPAPDALRPRSRWAGAVTAMLMAGLAVAALVAPAPTSPFSSTRTAAAPAPMATATVTTPPTPVAERIPASTMVDDGVPVASDRPKAGIGGCEHGL